jgi:D-sedoheptulose 7-phosphate isomerase
MINKSIHSLIRNHFQESARVKEMTAETCAESIEAAALMISHAFSSGGKLLLCGNGGSAADCQHIAAEFTSVLRQDFVRPGLPAIALTTDSSFMTARANDYGFEGIFARLVEAIGNPRDVLIGISTSGNSRNVNAGIELAREKGLKTIGITGASGGRLAVISEVVIKVPSTKVQHIQEAHIAIGHIICQAVEENMFSVKIIP